MWHWFYRCEGLEGQHCVQGGLPPQPYSDTGNGGGMKDDGDNRTVLVVLEGGPIIQ